MRYTKSYQSTHDIDWFFRDGERLVHVASNGAELPSFVDDVKNLRAIQTQVANMAVYEGIEVDINQEYVDHRFKMLSEILNIEITEESKENYLASFREMALKGFYSYDRDLVEKSLFHLICSPSKADIKHLWNCIPERSLEIVFPEEDKASFSINTSSFLFE